MTTTNDRRASASAAALLTAAKEMFSEKGYEGTSVADVTRRAGISVGTLYYHFDGKADLFTSLYREYARGQEQRVRTAVETLRAANVTDHRLQYIAGTRAYLLGAWGARDLSKIFNDPHAPTSFQQAGREVGSAWSERNFRFLTEGEFSFEKKALVAGLAGCMSSWVQDLAQIDDADDADAYIDGAIRLVVAPALGVSLNAREDAALD